MTADAQAEETVVDYPPLSALNDLLFCPRRCYLHTVEGIWIENVHTTSGTLAHRRVHTSHDSAATKTEFRSARNLWITSHRLKLTGVADVVEFHPDPLGGPDIPFPVEYKRGRRRRWDNDEVQVCAQALCLEEMLGVTVPSGAIFSVKSKRRRVVPITPELRSQTESAAARLHALLREATAPSPVVHPKCRQCSLYSICLPELIDEPRRYNQAARELFHPDTDAKSPDAT